MLKLIKGVLLNTLIVFFAEFVVFAYPASRFCQCKNQELVEFLVSYGVDPDFKFDDFRTLKEICADNGIEIKDEWLNRYTLP